MSNPDENNDNKQPTLNTLKVRDDPKPIKFLSNEKFSVLTEDCNASWFSGKSFKQKDLRGRIEPWLTALFQSEHLSLLIGSGITHAVCRIATDTGACGMDRSGYDFGEMSEKIFVAADKEAPLAGRATANIEDDLRVANDLLRGMQIVKSKKADSLKQSIDKVLEEFATSILKNETSIAAAEEGKRKQAVDTLVTFLMSFASRTGVRDRLNIFTTNYDRLIEAGAELAGLHLLDRFIGNLTPIFRSSRLDLDMHYNPPGIRGEPRYLEGVARFTKLHGSLDWIQADQDIRRIGLPFGAEEIKPYLKAPGLGGATPHQMMIYPNAAKDRETAGYPYVELFRDLAAALYRPNSTLVTYGYSFGDEHINRVIRDMLTIPSTHLVVISYNDPLGRIMETYEEMGRPSQISLLVGPELGDLSKLTENYLPKAAIDKTSFRMSELLRQRWGLEKAGDQPLENKEKEPSFAGGDLK